MNTSRDSHDHRIVAEQLTKDFDDHEVIRPLDLQIEGGTILGLIGPSGCGKTTTVRLLTGLLTPTSGRATVFGRDASTLTPADRSRIGYLPQQPALFPDLSLNENLSFHASMYGLPLRRRQRLDQLLDWVELGEHRTKRVADCSGGMQRRLALAAAFVHQPDVAFLDEPTAGIDPILREKLWDRFREGADAGTTLLVTTQYVSEAGQCDLVGLLSDGELLLVDTPENLRRAAFDGEVVDVTTERPIDDADLAAIEQLDLVIGEIQRVGAKRIRIVVDEADGAIARLTSVFAERQIPSVEIAEHIVDYDEAFVRVVERHRATGRPATSEPDEPDPGEDPPPAPVHDRDASSPAGVA